MSGPGLEGRGCLQFGLRPAEIPPPPPPHVGNARVGVVSMRGALLALLPLLLLRLRGSVIAVGRSGGCFLLVCEGSCIWSSCTVIRGRILMPSSLL